MLPDSDIASEATMGTPALKGQRRSLAFEAKEAQRSENPNGLAVYLLDDLIRPEPQRRRNREAERLRGLQVDDELESVNLLNGQFSGVGAQENALDEFGCELAHCVIAHAVAGKPPFRDTVLLR